MYLIFVTGASILSVEKFLIKGENCTFCVEKNLDNVFACEENHNYEACNAIFLDALASLAFKLSVTE